MDLRSNIWFPIVSLIKLTYDDRSKETSRKPGRILTREQKVYLGSEWIILENRHAAEFLVDVRANWRCV